MLCNGQNTWAAQQGQITRMVHDAQNTQLPQAAQHEQKAHDSQMGRRLDCKLFDIKAALFFESVFELFDIRAPLFFESVFGVSW